MKRGQVYEVDLSLKRWCFVVCGNVYSLHTYANVFELFCLNCVGALLLFRYVFFFGGMGRGMRARGGSNEGIIRNISKHSPGFMLIRFYLTKRGDTNPCYQSNKLSAYLLLMFALVPINHIRSGVKILYMCMHNAYNNTSHHK